MCNGFLPVEEEGVRGPDVTGQQVIQGKHLHRALKAKTLVLPALAEEHVNSVFLQNQSLNQYKLSRCPQLYKIGNNKRACHHFSVRDWAEACDKDVGFDLCHLFCKYKYHTNKQTNNKKKQLAYW